MREGGKKGRRQERGRREERSEEERVRGSVMGRRNRWEMEERGGKQVVQCARKRLGWRPCWRKHCLRSWGDIPHGLPSLNWTIWETALAKNGKTS